MCGCGQILSFKGIYWNLATIIIIVTFRVILFLFFVNKFLNFPTDKTLMKHMSSKFY